MIKNGLKQLFRTPIKTIGFLLLLIFAVVFLSLGGNLFLTSTRTLSEYDDAFTTAGTIQQKESGVEIMENFSNSDMMNSTIFEIPVYGDPIPVSVFDALDKYEGIEYIVRPEHRPIYTAYSNEIYENQIEKEKNISSYTYNEKMIVEFTPMQTYVPDHPDRCRVTKIFDGSERFVEEGDIIGICVDWARNPPVLEEGKTYIAQIFDVHNGHYDNSDYTSFYEWIPSNPLGIEKYNSEGEIIYEYTPENAHFSEVTEGFYETGEGRLWKKYMEGRRLSRYTMSVTPVNSIDSLMDFYTNETAMAEGREITKEEFAEGANVCILPQSLAEKYSFKVGDTITFDYLTADYFEVGIAPSWHSIGFGTHYIDKDWEIVEPFDTQKYEIVGIYEMPNEYEAQLFGVISHGAILPRSSIKGSDEGNIVRYGPMKTENSGFILENGTAEKFLEAYTAEGLDEILKVEIYDGGFSEIKENLDSIKTVAIVLLIVGAVTTLAVILFFCYLFISKQKKRTAIERSLGVKKRSCAVGLLIGILLIAILGSAVGSVIAYYSAEPMNELVEEFTTVAKYSLRYSNWKNAFDKRVEFEATIMADPVVSISICLAVIIMTMIIASIYVWQNLKAEPLELLSKRE